MQINQDPTQTAPLRQIQPKRRVWPRPKALAFNTQMNGPVVQKKFKVSRVAWVVVAVSSKLVIYAPLQWQLRPGKVGFWPIGRTPVNVPNGVNVREIDKDPSSDFAVLGHVQYEGAFPEPLRTGAVAAATGNNSQAKEQTN